MINFDELPQIKNNPTELQPTLKGWKIPPITFDKRLIKIVKIKNQMRLTLPAQLCQTYNLGVNYKNYKAYFIYYEAQGKLRLFISQNIIEDANYVRNIHPVSSGLCFTVIPYNLVRRIGQDAFPEHVWLQNTDQSTEEDIILEVWPA